MITDLTHNKIISDTLTDKFIASADSVLVELVKEAFGEGAIAIQMYEDHIADGFTRDGRWFYPLTVLTDSGAEIFWISWSVDKKRYSGQIPYSYVGDGPIDFRRETEVPEEFKALMQGRNIYAPNDYVKIKLHTASEDPLFLSGKCSQTFIDEMARQLTEEISRAMLISGLDEAELSLQMIFAPDTYMEHTSENVTYRRLRLADKTSAPRDFWIKWTRTNSAVAYSVSDTPALGTIKFELGEDVPHKIREKEYRFILATDADKYHTAMSRKNVTEWRELIKRAVKRGELEREVAESPAATTPEDDDKLNALLASIAAATSVPPAGESTVGEPDNSLDAVLRKLLEDHTEEETEATEPEYFEPTAEDVDEPQAEAEPLAEESDEEENNAEAPEELADLTIEEVAAPVEEKTVIIEEIKENDDNESEISAIKSEDEIRAEIEARVRLEYESIARMKAEEEAKRLLEEQEKLRRENERLLAEARRAEELRAKQEAERAEREAKLKAEIEAKVRAEAREKERLQEAAMLAIEQKRKLEREREEAERKAEEARRKEAERLAMEERVREEARRMEEERRRREEEERAAKERAEAEAAKAKELAEAAKTPAKKNYTFTSKRVLFIFHSHVDPAITEPMEKIIRATLEQTGKTDVPINVKASVVDEMSVCLDFVRIPQEEEELLIKIVQALGRGNLGIVKARVE